MARNNSKSNREDFKIIKQKENIDSNIDDKILLLEKQMTHNHSYNDQYLLTNSAENSAVGKTQHGSVSFHFQSVEPEKEKHVQKYQTSNESALILLLNEFERRFEMIEQRLENSERFNRMTDNKYVSQEHLNELIDKFSKLINRVGKIERNLKNLEEEFLKHKIQTDKRIIEFNQHVDSSLQQFINSSIKIQKKLNKLTNNDQDNYKLKFDQINQNINKTQILLEQQMGEFAELVQQVQQISEYPIVEEMENLKSQYEQVIEYVKQLQDSLSN